MSDNKWGIYAPLAAKLRPKTLADFVGQKHLVAEGALLRRLIDADNIPSMVFWGPPGVGKTTLAQIIAGVTQAEFINFSATSSGIKEVRTVMDAAQTQQQWGKKTIVFVDEIHRFNKGQQDAFLPYVENGSVILIGATTENPSFEVNSALLSRCKVFLLYGLTNDDILELLNRAVAHFCADAELVADVLPKHMEILAEFASGDARMALNTIEMVLNSAQISDGQLTLTDELIQQSVTKRLALYDKQGEEHYNLISALHKSMRNSDADAAVYWLARMLDGGEDPLYIARRLIRFASEDIGLADSNALLLAVAAYQSCHFNGMPECNVNLAHAVIYMAAAPKSNALDSAMHAALMDAQKTPTAPVPLVIRNAPTKLMKQLNYGKGYQYAHDLPEKMAKDMECLPDELVGKQYYHPTNEGREGKYAVKLRRG